MKDHLPPTPRTLGAGPWRWPTRPPLRVWVWTAAALALVVAAALLWRNSDAAATGSTTATAADIPPGTPAAGVSRLWSATGRLLPEELVESGRVLVGSAHGVRALDPLSGREAWHYTRSNAHLCGLTATDGVAVAVFRTGSRCDEAVALDAGTGVRAWTRNVSFAGDVRLDSTDRIVLASAPHSVVTLDPTGDNTRWRYRAPQGCRLLGADVGSSGVAVLQRCGDSSDVQLRLLDGFGGTALWTRDLSAPPGSTVRLLDADQVLGVLVGDQVQLLSGKDGAVLQTRPVPAAAADQVQQLSYRTLTFVRIAGTLTALDASTGAPLWQVPAIGLPAVLQTPGTAEPAALLVPDDGGFAHRDPATGAETGRSTAAGVPTGGTAFVAGPAVIYRLPDRVLAFG